MSSVYAGQPGAHRGITLRSALRGPTRPTTPCGTAQAHLADMNPRTEERLEQRFDTAIHRADEDIFDKVWPARILQMAIGVWLIISSFAWHHLPGQAPVAQGAGVLAIVFALAGGFYSPFRALNGLLPAWLLIATLFQTARVGTIVNNLFCALAIFALTFAPRGGIRLFREERHPEERRPLVAPEARHAGAP